MVCLGNICRSPLAVGILKHKSSHLNIKVDSAGTSNYHIGSLPDSRSIDIAKKFGLDITDQRGRQFSVKDFDKFDFIYAMDINNYKNILALARNENDKKKVDLILNLAYPNQNMDVPDPYHGGEQGFKNVYEMLDKACDVLLERFV
jgi:protein-tyrosine phosphatase